MSVKQRRSRVVAVVEDDQSSRVALGRLLRAYGFEVALFDSAEAYLAAQPLQPLCLILDVNLPGLSGLELHERCQAAGVAPPTIIVTALPIQPFAAALKRMRPWPASKSR